MCLGNILQNVSFACCKLKVIFVYRNGKTCLSPPGTLTQPGSSPPQQPTWVLMSEIKTLTQMTGHKESCIMSFSFPKSHENRLLVVFHVGPVYVHNPGTVIFSLLNQFTGQVGPTISGKRAERTSNEEEEERNCPVFHPASSPGIHFSEEERSGEVDNIFFPSQEQGKDCHISKEEAFAGKP